MADDGLPPFFILGTMRSGTTLLRLMLDSHPNISVGFETGFMRAAAAIKNVPDWNYGEGWYRRYGLTEEEMNARVRAFYSEIFQRHAESQGKHRWGEKTPMHVHHLRELNRIFPEGKLLVIVRHAGAVAVSMSRWPRYSFETALRSWGTVNRRFRKLASELGPERLHMCRYEDLVTDPRSTLAAILQFIAEPWSDDVLRHHEIQAARGVRKVEGGTRADRALDRVSLDGWVQAISPAQMDALRERARLLHYFGYGVETAVPQGPLPPEHSKTPELPLPSS